MDPIEKLTRVVDQTLAAQTRNERCGQVSAITCPECGSRLRLGNETIPDLRGGPP